MAPKTTTATPAPPALRTFDDQVMATLAAQSPAGIRQGKGWAKDEQVLTAAINATRFQGFVFVGNETFDLDEPRGEWACTLSWTSQLMYGQ